MFRGINLLALDNKGRLTLPARYCRLLPMDKEPQVVVTIDTESPCLLLYPFQEWELIEEKLQALPSFNPEVRRIQRLLIGHATDLSLDKSGRILLSGLLREHACLEKAVMLVGQGRKIELWDANTWNQYRLQWIKETAQRGELPDELRSLAL